MVEKSDRAPLLDWEEVPPAEKRVSTPEQEKDVKGPSPANNRALGCTAQGIGWSTSPGGPGSFTSAVPHDIMVKWEEKDPIVAVFVVTFDTRSGLLVIVCRNCIKELGMDSFELGQRIDDPNHGMQWS
ncbi:unnamed protein product [Oncorhynchus mykiss]|uniref:Uncharacterized protein n=1 Tax=Oncorhynchus mykiss TaxID=8022 RepID=A0A060XVU9_ONCMY|nr:unnamed protein product [Oncorhynchus mykiss]